MKPEYLAEIKRFRLMDDDFMSKCLEHAPVLQQPTRARQPRTEPLAVSLPVTVVTK